ncbi:uncharacterized protein [Dermacentor albipictus]|uniref:uncharacterized protein isoform X4 n=1 Tax=Dermacentor albipictus TaxID=60249 RepID=UPI0038FCBD1E
MEILPSVVLHDCKKLPRFLCGVSWDLRVVAAVQRKQAALPLSSLRLPFCSSAPDALHNCAPLPSAVRYKMSLNRPVSQHFRENRRKDTWHSVWLYSGPTRGGTALPISCTSRKAGNARAMAPSTWILLAVLYVWTPLITSEEEVTTATAGGEVTRMRRLLFGTDKPCKTFGEQGPLPGNKKE